MQTYHNEFYERAYAIYSILSSPDWKTELIDTLFNIWMRPVILSDYTHKILYEQHGDITVSPTLEKLLTQSEYPMEWINEVFHSAVDEMKARVEVRHYIIEGESTLSSPLIWDGTNYGYLSIKDDGKIKSKEDFELIKVACQVAACRMAQNKEQSSQSQGKTVLLHDIMKGIVTNTAELEKRMLYCSWPQNEYYQVAGISLSQSEGFPNEAYFLRFFMNISEHIVVIGYEDYFYFLLTGNSKKQLQYIGDQIAQYQIQQGNKIGLSEVFQNLLMITKKYKQAQIALSLGVENGVDITHYEKEKLGDFLYEITRRIDVEDYYNNSVTELLNYDRNNHTNLSETLYVFLSQDKSVNVNEKMSQVPAKK